VRALNVSRGSTIATDMAVADSLWTKFRGLMGRSRASFPAGSGLWFEGTSSIHMMFMRFPIDCVFLSRADSSGVRRVVGLRRSLPAWRGVVWVVRGAHGLIELPAGAVEASGTVVGDEVRFEG
jgi:uncharacterized membrane protein (UPF0127 family)